ncbi:MAG: DUF4065 domain-containing protein [Candidatus Aadella gelida]|nr:DUF4065 domain-containing protein [Candidatus Aadella gelida]
MEGYCPKCNMMVDYSVKAKKETFPVKGEDVEVISQVAFCGSCNDEIFNEKLDANNLDLAYNEYRKKHKLLLPDEITKIREKYSLSQRALGRLLEWGEITVNRYENGAMQDTVHNEVLLFIAEPMNMRTIFERNKHLLSERVSDSLRNKIEQLVRGEMPQNHLIFVSNLVAVNSKVDIFSGFKRFDLEKMINLILYIAEKNKGVFTTKLNKLLWYADFIHFRVYSTSITGSVYKHLPLGPVPNDYKWIIAAAEKEGLEEEEIDYPSGKGGTMYSTSVHIEDSNFNEEELKIIDFTVDYFKNYNSGEIKDKSHNEKGYKETQKGESISYKYAEKLSVAFEE